MKTEFYMPGLVIGLVGISASEDTNADTKISSTISSALLLRESIDD